MSRSCRSLISYALITSRSDRLTYVTEKFRRPLIMTIEESDEYILFKMDFSMSISYVMSEIKYRDLTITYHNVLCIIVRQIQSCKKTSKISSSYARRHFREFLNPVRLSRSAWNIHVQMISWKIQSELFRRVLQSSHDFSDRWSPRAIWRLILGQLWLRKSPSEIKLVSSVMSSALTVKHIWVILQVLT